MGWLSTPERIWKPSRSRFAFLLVSAVAFAVTEFGRFVARPWVRSNNINDLGLTDSIGNLGGIAVMIFFGCAVMNPTRKQSYRIAAFYSICFILYEFAQPYLPKGVFDWMDVVGTAIGYGISLPILAALWHVIPHSEGDEIGEPRPSARPAPRS